jgi:hypothetical protein
MIKSQTPFHAYSANRSASEFSVTPSHGMIEPTLLTITDIPIDVLFAPKMDGKVLKGLLVIDTTDAQFLFGKLELPVGGPEAPEEVGQKKRRNIVKENIENVRIIKPAKSLLQSFPSLLHEFAVQRCGVRSPFNVANDRK